MNVLFLLKTLDLGGVEVVTATLANKFVEEGHYVSVFAFEKKSGMLLERFVQNIKVTIAGKYHVTNENIKLLRDVLKKQNIQVVVNQWGLPYIPIRTLCKAKEGMDIKVISVYHNDPLMNGRIQDVVIEIQKSDNRFKKVLLRCKKYAYRCVTGFSMRYNYNHSDLYEVLSPSYISHFLQFTWLKYAPKLVVLNNPITVKTDGYFYHTELKQKEIIYIGRLAYSPKRVHRVIEVWAQLEQCNPDWKLTIVGSGAEQEDLERMVSSLKLKNVNFEGIQQPRPYYERASMLIMTSEFEGFPLVLTECMGFGVVPVVYGSFSAVFDIIDEGKNGIIVPQTSSGFNATLMAEKIQELMTDKTRLNEMALSAIEKSKHYSLDRIYEQWMEIILRRIV